MMRATPFLVVTAAVSGCSLIGFGDWNGQSAVHASDASVELGDGGVVVLADASVNMPDAAVEPRPDASMGAPDAAMNHPDAAVPHDAGNQQQMDAGNPQESDAGNFGNPRCAASGLAICESFEDAPLGGFPDGWALRESFHWGGTSIGVANDDAARGSKALKIVGGDNGANFMKYDGDLGDLAADHYGRIFFKVNTPAPWPSNGVLHGDIVQGEGPSPATGVGSNVRWGVVENTQQQFQWIYNVQPYSDTIPEWGDGTDYNYSWPGAWQCLEWRWSNTEQTGSLWIDGQLIPITVGQAHAPELPVFDNLAVGWSNYQSAPGEGFTVWIDEVALDANRIGCTR